MLQTDRLASPFNTAFIVAFPGPSKTGFIQIVAIEGLKPIIQFPLRQPNDALHRRRQVVVDQPAGNPTNGGKSAHMAIKETDLVAPFIEPHQIPLRIHQPQQELPNLGHDPV